MTNAKSSWSRFLNRLLCYVWTPLSRGKVIQKIVIGVVTPALIALAYLAYEEVSNRLERQDQIDYLSSRLIEHRQWVYDTEGLQEGGRRDMYSEEDRTHLVEAMLREIRLALDHNASQLSYAEKRQLEIAIENWNRYPRFLKQGDIDSLFLYLESLDWLGLPPRSN